MSKNNRLNAIIGLLSQAVILIFGLIIPKIVIESYGSDMNGLVSTITQVFTYLALLEAGISQASRNALFKPIKDNDRNAISSVLSASRKYFRKVTIIYGIAVLGLSFIIPFLFKTNVDYITVFFIVLFEGMTNVISFYFINTWNCLLNSSGKTYIITSIELICKSICFITKIILALLKINFAVIQFSFFIVSLIKLAIYLLYMKKNFPWINYNSSKIYKLSDRNSYVITEIAWVVFSSTDLIILSVFVSTASSSVYSLYSMVFSSLSLLLNSVYSSLCFNLGQTFHKDIEKYKRLHDCFNSIFMGGITILISTAYILVIPFIVLYTKGVNDTNYVVKALPILFSLIQFLSWSRYVSGNLTGVAGYAKKVSKVSIVEALINIIFSMIFVKIWGIVGVTLATVIALPVKTIYCNYLCERRIMNRSYKKTILIYTVNILCLIGNFLIGILYKPRINSYFEFIIHGIVIFIFEIIVIFFVNYLVNRNYIKQFFLLFKH